MVFILWSEKLSENALLFFRFIDRVGTGSNEVEHCSAGICRGGQVKAIFFFNVIIVFTLISVCTSAVMRDLKRTNGGIRGWFNICFKFLS